MFERAKALFTQRLREAGIRGDERIDEMPEAKQALIGSMMGESLAEEQREASARMREGHSATREIANTPVLLNGQLAADGIPMVEPTRESEPADGGEGGDSLGARESHRLDMVMTESERKSALARLREGEYTSGDQRVYYEDGDTYADIADLFELLPHERDDGTKVLDNALVERLARQITTGHPLSAEEIGVLKRLKQKYASGLEALRADPDRPDGGDYVNAPNAATSRLMESDRGGDLLNGELAGEGIPMASQVKPVVADPDEQPKNGDGTWDLSGDDIPLVDPPARGEAAASGDDAGGDQGDDGLIDLTGAGVPSARVEHATAADVLAQDERERDEETAALR